MELFDKKLKTFPQGSIKRICTEFFPINRETVCKIWREYQQQKLSGTIVPTFFDKRRLNKGRPLILTDELKAQLKTVLESRLGRIAYREIASRVELPLTTTHHYLKRMGVVNQSSPVNINLSFVNHIIFSFQIII